MIIEILFYYMTEMSCVSSKKKTKTYKCEENKHLHESLDREKVNCKTWINNVSNVMSHLSKELMFLHWCNKPI